MIPPRQEFDDRARSFIERKPKEQTSVFPAIGYEIAQNVNAFEELGLTEENDRRGFVDDFELHLIHCLKQQFPDPTKKALRGYDSPSSKLALTTEAKAIKDKKPYERIREMSARGLAYAVSNYFGMSLIYGIGIFVSAKDAKQSLVTMEEKLRQTLAPLYTTYRNDIATARSLEQKLYS